MNNITRRKALKGAGAALAVSSATVTLGFPAMAKADDLELLARVAVFWEAYRDHETKGDISHACYERMEAIPEFPGFPKPLGGGMEAKKWEAAYNQCGETSGYHPAYEIWDEAGTCMGAAANAVFAIPAQTVRGAYEKLRIARFATGATAEGGDGDADLCAYQDFASPWIDNAIADLERLGGAS